MRRAAIALATVIVFLAVFLLVEKTSSPFFQTCISQDSGDESAKAGNKSHSTIGAIFIVYARCSGRFVDGHGAGITALFTIVLAASTILLWRVTKTAAEAAKAAAEHIPRVERAYVRLSHCAPGLMFSATGCDVRLEVKTLGSTPARVTNVVLNFRIFSRNDLPTRPTYDVPDREPIRVFLLPNEPIFITERSQIRLAEVRDLPRERALYLFGYVDYIDVFDVRQRGGYGRIYEPDGQPNNLGLITQDGYNYDEIRVPGEGNDWPTT